MAKRNVLITGVTGFAGSHLAEFLIQSGDSEVIGTHVSDTHLGNLSEVKDTIRLHKVNLLDAAAVSNLVAETKPDVVYHLAALSAPADSFKNPAGFIENNISSELNVLEAIKNEKLTDTKILITSSAEVYGMVASEDLPLRETAPMKPTSPYGVSKIAQDFLGASYYRAYGLKTILIRPFNHIGPRLSPNISVSRWAKTIAEIEKGNKEPVMHVGNMTTKRDFTDVRDMIKAYTLAIDACLPGEAYNIGTGISYSMQEILEKLLSLSPVKITVESDQSLFRPTDIPELRADAEKFVKLTHWKPEISIEKTLEDTLDYWRRIV